MLSLNYKFRLLPASSMLWDSTETGVGIKKMLVLNGSVKI
jgi:hypothetical protein